ncbi:MAG: DUF29 domain-containing protein [Xenococcaceae cyanobacterium]
MTTPLPTKTLYEQDYCLWIEETVKILREGRLSELDIPNLIEEMEDMGKSQKQAFRSNLRVLLMHLLKWKYQKVRRSNSWCYTIVEHRKRLKEALKDSPSLKPYLAEVFDECYRDARDLASAETALPLDTFPIETPFSLEETLNSDYLPD